MLWIVDVKAWALENKLVLNDAKTEFIHFRSRFSRSTKQNYITSLRNRKPNPDITNKHWNWVKDGKFPALEKQFSAELSEMCDINYNAVMESVTNLIHYWLKRII